MSCKDGARRLSDSQRWGLLFLGALAFLCTLFLSTNARAEPEWCVRELEKTDEQVLVLHNPECDLRILPRLYPLRDDEGKALPMQIQLRSLFAANQTRTVGGVKYRYTVMRGCVSPGIPSKDADAEELAMCPKGLMNYFSAPASDAAARIVIPHKRQLTVAESYRKLSEMVCSRLQNTLTDSEEDKNLASECVKSFTKMSFGVKTVNKPDGYGGDIYEVDRKLIKKLQDENAVLGTKLAVIKSTDDKSRFIFPMFFMLVGLALFGAAATVFAIKAGRDRKALQSVNAIITMSQESIRQELIAKAYADAKREFFEKQKAVLKAHKARVEKEQSDAWGNLLAKQQNEITALKRANDGLIVLEVEIRELKNQSVGKDQQIDELQREIKALSERNSLLESEDAGSHNKTREVLREKAALELRVADLEERVSSLTRECSILRESIRGKNAHEAVLLARIASFEKEVDKAKNEKSALEVRLEQLLEAAVLCGAGINIGKSQSKIKTLPPGDSADELANGVKDEIAESFVADSIWHYSVAESVGQVQKKPDDWEVTTITESIEEIQKLAHDSTRSLPMEGADYQVVAIPVMPDIPPDFNPDDLPSYREEMPTLEREIPASKIAEEQMIHYRKAWLILVQVCGQALNLDLTVSEYSNVESINTTIVGALKRIGGEYSAINARLADRNNKITSAAVRITELEAMLNAKTAEHAGAVRVAQSVRKSFDQLALDIKGGKAVEKLYAYQLAKLQAEERAIHTEIALRDALEELQNIKKEPLSLGVLLQLDQKDRVPAYTAFADLSDDELLRVTGTLFQVIADRVKKGIQLEFPLASDADLGDIRHMMMLPLVSDYPYEMPAMLKRMAGQGLPRLYHAMHDNFAGTQHRAAGNFTETILPSAGVPEDRNSASPDNSDNLQFKPKEDVCQPSASKDDDSHGAS